MGPPKPDLVGGLPVCKWLMDDGGFVQVGSFSASDWAQGLPELLRILDNSGLAKGADDKRKLQKMRDLIAAKGAVTPTEACDMFSTMLELQGQPPGTPWIVNVVPSNEEPLSMSGQMCSAGRFTTVSVANEDGLAKPLPVDKVARALKLAHRRSLG